MNIPRVLVVIISHYGEKWIETCIKSVLENNYANIEILMIDNLSKDNTLSIVKQKFKSAIIFESSRNLGFGKASNIGINYALSNNFDYLFLLNQDVTLSANCIRSLVETCEKQHNIGIASPFQLTYDGSQLDPAFENLLKANESCREFSTKKTMSTETFIVDTTIGAAMFFRTSLFKVVGPFDPQFFLYHEEGDLCRRARYHGFEIHVVPHAQIFHWHTQLNPSEMSFRAKWSSLYGYYLYILKDPFRSSTENFCIFVKQVAASIFRDKMIAKIMKRFLINSFAFFFVLYRIPSLLNRRSQEMRGGMVF
jgi:GT2 family glycosyltransferase